MINRTGEQASLFDAEVDEPSTETAAPGVDPDELRHATARVVVTSAPDATDPKHRAKVLLVVDCPFCDHQHVHPGGRVGDIRLGERRARCIGRPSGRYLIRAVGA